MDQPAPQIHTADAMAGVCGGAMIAAIRDLALCFSG
jgi:hypothetical protein